MNWKGVREGPRDNITKCSFTLQASRNDIKDGLPAENHFTCTRTLEPENPVTVTEDCKVRGIETWPNCNNECIALAAGRGYSAQVDGGMGNISACHCNYGRNRENSFTCYREPTYPPIPQPLTRREKCSDSGPAISQLCRQCQWSPLVSLPTWTRWSNRFSMQGWSGFLFALQLRTAEILQDVMIITQLKLEINN